MDIGTHVHMLIIYVQPCFGAVMLSSTKRATE